MIGLRSGSGRDHFRFRLDLNLGVVSERLELMPMEGCLVAS